MPNASRPATAGLVLVAVLLLAGCEDPRYLDPPASLTVSDLVGTWETHYSETRLDRIEIRQDGAFKQTYKKSGEPDYVWETPWNEWRLERLRDGLVRVHLEGAAWWMLAPPYRRGGHFHDPYTQELTFIQNELVLHVRMDSKGELLLHHLWISVDSGFALIGGEVEVFRRVD
jgi:hypothetical protein